VATPPGVAQRLESERLRYPAMLPREIIVWRNWLKAHESEYSFFAYNVRVGQGYDPGESVQPSIRRQAILNSQKRIDAVGWKGGHVAPAPPPDTLIPEAFLPVLDGEPTLFEVKDRLTASGIGQLFTYEVLWSLSFPTAPKPKIALVANRLAEDVAPILAKYSVTLYLVEADFSELRRLP
jgi:hypothetical protein